MNLDIQDPRPWRDAFAEFRNGNPEPLAALLRTDEPADYIRQELAEVIAQAPLKRPRNADKRNATKAQRQYAAFILQSFDQLFPSTGERAGKLADELGMEPQDVVRRVAEMRRKLLADLSEEIGLKPDTIRKLKRGK